MIVGASASSLPTTPSPSCPPSRSPSHPSTEISCPAAASGLSNNTMNDSRTKNLFDIPELLHRICAFLSAHDLTRCVLVCRSWHALCTPLLWSSIKILDSTRYYQFLAPQTSVDALSRNGRHVRSITTLYYNLLTPLLSQRVDCSNLTHLVFPQSCRFTDPPLPARALTDYKNYHNGDEHGSDNINHNDHLNSRAREPQAIEQLLGTNLAMDAGNTSAAMTGIQQSSHPHLYQPSQRPTEIRARSASGLFKDTMLIEMMRKSPQLRVLTVVGFPFDHDELFANVAKQLVRGGLRKLELTNLHYCEVKASSLKRLLDSCTPALEELVLSISFGSFAQVEPGAPMAEEMPTVAESNGVDDSSASPDQDFERASPPFYPNKRQRRDRVGSPRPWGMKKLTLKGNLSGQGPLIWLSLLRQCSQVQVISVDIYADSALESLAQAIRDHCPLANELTIQCMTGSPQEDSRIAAMIGASSASWKHLAMSFFHGLGPLSATALLQHSATLEALVLEECDGVGSEDIQMILCTCPNLKTFKAMTSNGMDFSSTVYLDANEMIDSPWICRSLENLKVVITGMARPDLKTDQYGNTLTGPLHDGTIQGYDLQSIVYHQLGSLPKLQVLWLGHDKQDLDDEGNYHPTATEGQWRYIDPDEQFECLEFSLKSGLGLLSGLKDLRVLNIDRLRTRIGLSEVQWMSDQWPKLETIIGLVIQGEKVPKHIQWLYDHRPDIELPPVLGSFTTAF
ncbi:hypothetical protein BGW38_002778 [Lunasporangiospora selenospora]|uniref:F-box domain-containing protein n=1 Tax=Lunasporangiospora selenospora TaxID=979761 RepID=A0A9P6G2Y3_9FUNG|nr:hypothetical protein BGW38_002778 [Lunasporangiospora selenospora]